MRNFVTAWRTLTAIPLLDWEEGPAEHSLPWFPVVGFLCGLMVYAAALAAGRVLPVDWPGGIALLAVVTGVVVTGGLHLDGLADAADAFFSRSSRERMLEIMKDSRVGTFGVLMLLGVLACKWISLTRLIEDGQLVWLLPAYTISRAMQVELAVCLPYAREEGGTASEYVRNALNGHRLVALIVAAFVATLFCGLWGFAALASGWVVARAVGALSRRNVGGVTGDVLGACSEVTETWVLVLSAAII